MLGIWIFLNVLICCLVRKEAATKAQSEVNFQKQARVKRKEKAKRSSVNKSFPENLERKEEHICPEGYNPEE